MKEDPTRKGLELDEQTAVLDTAFQVIGDRGLEADFVERVAKKSGVSAERIYFEYSSLTRLLQVLMERELEVIAGSVTGPELRFPGETVRDELGVMARILLEECRSHVGFLRTILIEAIRSPEFANGFYETFILRGRRRLTELLELRKDRGELREDLDVEAAAAFFLSALIFSLLLLEIFGGKSVERVDDSRLIVGLLDTFLNGILPR